jgi:hypothetical protein
MGLVGKSVRLTQEDIDYCEHIGRNLSDGIRYCINQSRFSNKIIDEIKRSISIAPQNEISLSANNKNKILRITEDE